jgi:hypothetical protein
MKKQNSHRQPLRRNLVNTARCLVDAVEGDKRVGDDDSHAPILEQGLIAFHSQRP